MDSLHFATARAEVARDAELRLGRGRRSAASRQGPHGVAPRGPGSTVRADGRLRARRRQHLDLDTTQEHDAPNAISDLAFKGVLPETSRSVWRGVIRVAPGAQGTDAYQENRNLLLSPKAHADSIPGLEINANDVRCTHGATVGRVDPELLFYLMSRGLERREAERMMVEGFFADALERIENLAVRERFAAALALRTA